MNLKRNKQFRLRGEKGFTLVEMLMAFSVMVILMAVLSVSASGGFKAFAKAKQETELMRNVTLAFEIMRRDLLGSIYIDPWSGSPLSGVNFEGLDAVDGSGSPDDKVRFFSLLSPESAARADLTSINYKRETVSGINRLSRASRGTDSTGIPALNLDGVETFEPLLFHITSFSAEYLPTPAGPYQATYDASVAGQLPEAVRLEIKILIPGGKEKTFTQTVRIAME